MNPVDKSRATQVQSPARKLFAYFNSPPTKKLPTKDAVIRVVPVLSIAVSSIVFCCLPATGAGSDSSQSAVALHPIYVEQGAATIPKLGCTISLFDAGGSERGFEQLRTEYRSTAAKNGSQPIIDVLLISHIHKDHTSYLPKRANDKVRVRTIISNLHAKTKADSLGLVDLAGAPKNLFPGHFDGELWFYSVSIKRSPWLHSQQD